MPLRTFHHDDRRHSARPTDEAHDAAAVSFPPFPRACPPLAALGKAAERRMSHGRDEVLWGTIWVSGWLSTRDCGTAH